MIIIIIIIVFILINSIIIIKKNIFKIFLGWVFPRGRWPSWCFQAEIHIFYFFLG